MVTEFGNIMNGKLNIPSQALVVKIHQWHFIYFIFHAYFAY